MWSLWSLYNLYNLYKMWNVWNVCQAMRLWASGTAQCGQRLSGPGPEISDFSAANKPLGHFVIRNWKWHERNERNAESNTQQYQTYHYINKEHDTETNADGDIESNGSSTEHDADSNKDHHTENKTLKVTLKVDTDRSTEHNTDSKKEHNKISNAESNAESNIKRDTNTSIVYNNNSIVHSANINKEPITKSSTEGYWRLTFKVTPIVVPNTTPTVATSKQNTEKQCWKKRPKATLQHWKKHRR